MPRRLIAALALWPSLALAGPDLSYGVALDGRHDASELHLAHCAAGCFAQVTYVNRFLRGDAWTRQFTLDLDGLSVGVTITDGTGASPERVAVTAPPGFYAEPAEIEVNEDADGVIALYPIPMS
ncbi:hypothetical protein [Rubellimicrobium arenae]|uniref:hypothetical protein n=1 Tax=Rubellimicrobium arenae TaxID=2817372 RepID=UPI001B304814|nr:hypothetical protein [Rubellimicrobium arenae]